MAQRGERLFWLGGCASCHAASDDGEAALRLGGGEALETPFGTFHPPNISPDPGDGIGRWSLADFANAMQRGVSPDGRHYYPAFPYNSYVNMTRQEVADLFAYLKTLPPVAGRAPEHELPFPFNIRRGVGLWQLAFLGEGPIAPLAPDAPDLARQGQHLVEGLGHCGECHTARGLSGLGDLDASRWLAGARAPEGEGGVPNITPAGDTGDWSAEEIAEYLETGFTPDYDSVGGLMVAVQKNMAHLPDEDRQAIAAYLKALPPVK